MGDFFKTWARNFSEKLNPEQRADRIRLEGEGRTDNLAFEARRRAQEAAKSEMDPMSPQNQIFQDSLSAGLSNSSKALGLDFTPEEIKPAVSHMREQDMKNGINPMEVFKTAAQLRATAATAKEKGKASSGKDSRLTANEVRRQAGTIYNADKKITDDLRTSLLQAQKLQTISTEALTNPVARGAVGFLAARAAGSNSQLSDAERAAFTKAGGTPLVIKQALNDLTTGTLRPEYNKFYQLWLQPMRRIAEDQLVGIRKTQVSKMKSMYSPEVLKGFDLDTFFQSGGQDEEPGVADSGAWSPEKEARLNELRKKAGR